MMVAINFNFNFKSNQIILFSLSKTNPSHSTSSSYIELKQAPAIKKEASKIKIKMLDTSSNSNLHDNEKFFSKLLSKESSVSNPSFRVYYGAGKSIGVPFIWESKPGKPKHMRSHKTTTTVFSDHVPPLTPPPSYYNSKHTVNPLKKRSNSTMLFDTIFPYRLAIHKKTNSFSSEDSSSSFSVSLASSHSTSSVSGSHSRRSRGSSRSSSSMGSRSSWFDFRDEDDETGSGSSMSCFGIVGNKGMLRS